MPNVTANFEVIDQNLSAVFLLPTTRTCLIATGRDLVFVVLPVGVDMLHAGS